MVVLIGAVVLSGRRPVAFEREDGFSGMRQRIKRKLPDIRPHFPLPVVTCCELVIGHHDDISQIIRRIVVQALSDSRVGQQSLFPLQLALPFPIPANEHADA